MADPLASAPMSDTPRTCVTCGSASLTGREEPITRKRRVKFGATWLVLTILSAGLAIPVWLMWPRTHETVSVDRWVQCQACGGRQP